MNSMLEARAKCWSPDLPLLISGGKAIGVAGWEEARAASLYGLENGVPTRGTIGGTGLPVVVSRLLQDGDPGGHLSRAFKKFPHQELAERVWDQWYIEGGREGRRPDYKPTPMFTFHPKRDIAELTIMANYAPVWLAQEGGLEVNINYLMKSPLPRLYEMLGAMLAGVGGIVIGAGIPWHMRQIMEKFARYEEASYALEVDGGGPNEFVMTLNPASFVPENKIDKMHNPRFLTIVSGHQLAKYVANERKMPGGVDGFIVAYSGINAGHSALNRSGEINPITDEPVWDEKKDYADLEEMVKLKIPFWLAGGQVTPEKVREALAAGATGVQVGSITAASEESGFREDIKYWLRKLGYNNELVVRTDRRISPTKYFFNKVCNSVIPGGMNDGAYQMRKRVCDLGYLRIPYKKPDGTLGYRCSADDVEAYTSTFIDPKKTPEENLEEMRAKATDTIGRECLCNELCAGCGLGQKRRRKIGSRVLWEEELARVTFGHDTENMYKFFRSVMGNEEDTYTVAQAFDSLLGKEVQKCTV